MSDLEYFDIDKFYEWCISESFPSGKRIGNIEYYIFVDDAVKKVHATCRLCDIEWIDIYDSEKEIICICEGCKA